MSSSFQRGDTVVHPRRPEWGRGIVRQAATITHQGARAQRLTVEFVNKGRVTINTAVAPLASPKEGEHTHMNSTQTQSSAGGGWLGELERATNNSNSRELWSLPESMTDPFLHLSKRLDATLESYRFSTEPRSLIDWAVLQTGMDDPLSRYTRQELEQAFPRFARDRDQHLLDLVRQAKRNGDHELIRESHRRARHPAAKTALEKAVKR